MNGPKKSEPAKIIATLNALNVGEMDLIRAKLDQARQACLDLEQQELAARLGEASSALLKADLKTYRKRVESVISQLGHLK
jgi:hypothetical protein